MHRKVFHLRYSFHLIVFTSLFFCSCLPKNKSGYVESKKQLQIADSLIAAGQSGSALIIIKDTRSKITNSDPSIITCYRLLASHYTDDYKVMNLYADSALAFFNSDTRINNYPNEYFYALTTKADGYLKAKKYIAALSYYFKSQAVPRSDCDDGDLDTKLGTIYYDQKNFLIAARYWTKSYYRLSLCHDRITKEKLFGLKQGALNNTGFSYERAGVLDSANYFYLKDLEVIEHADSDHISNKNDISGAKVVVYDNLGGLNILSGNLKVAEAYLNKCLAIPTPDVDGLKIPPLIKMAQLYIELGNYKKAAVAFEKSRKLLNRFDKDNPRSEVNWNKYYAEYFFKLRQFDKAYLYKNRYIKLRDSIDERSSDLYRLDIERELSGLGQQQAISELKQKDKIKIIYIIGISVIVFLSVVIILLINRNLERAKKNHKSAANDNLKLKYTLAELERVNKNYIRIMRVMAHDLRNPLSGMTGLAAMLLAEEEFSDDIKHMLKLIETTGVHTLEMINELLKAGLADEHEEIQKQTVDLRALLYDSVELLQFRASEKQQQLLLERDSVPIIAQVNHENIWRVFNNLIVNAIKFSHYGGFIRISIKLQANCILIAIADDGIGIPDKDKDNVFEMFTPAKKSGTNGEEPFGLGLSISKKIIEKHDGKIWFESQAGKGTIFYITLPL